MEETATKVCNFIEKKKKLKIRYIISKAKYVYKEINVYLYNKFQ